MEATGTAELLQKTPGSKSRIKPSSMLLALAAGAILLLLALIYIVLKATNDSTPYPPTTWSQAKALAKESRIHPQAFSEEHFISQDAPYQVSVYVPRGLSERETAAALLNALFANKLNAFGGNEDLHSVFAYHNGDTIGTGYTAGAINLYRLSNSGYLTVEIGDSSAPKKHTLTFPRRELAKVPKWQIEARFAGFVLDLIQRTNEAVGQLNEGNTAYDNGRYSDALARDRSAESDFSDISSRVTAVDTPSDYQQWRRDFIAGIHFSLTGAKQRVLEAEGHGNNTVTPSNNSIKMGNSYLTTAMSDFKAVPLTNP